MRTSVEQSVPRADDVKLLHGFAVDGKDHFGRPLRDHLVACSELLSSWGAPTALCRAGLFHSIYGTATYRDAAVDVAERDRVRAAIGTHAERLAYLFCFGDRRRLMLENAQPPYRWRDHVTGDTVDLDDESFHALVMLEVANFVEQLPFIDTVGDHVITDMRERIAAQGRWLSPRMWASLDAALAIRYERRGAS